MHGRSMRIMKYFRDKYGVRGMTVLDIGSCIVDGQNSCYRTVFEPSCKYTGMDIVPGRNVDIVGYENITGTYDVVVSGNVMEHVRRPWEWLKGLVPYFDRYICITAPNAWKEHRHPIDTYRYLPDGIVDLFDYAGISVLEAAMWKEDTFGVGGKAHV